MLCITSIEIEIENRGNTIRYIGLQQTPVHIRCDSFLRQFPYSHRLNHRGCFLPLSVLLLFGCGDCRRRCAVYTRLKSILMLRRCRSCSVVVPCWSLTSIKKELKRHTLESKINNTFRIQNYNILINLHHFERTNLSIWNSPSSNYS